MIAECLADALDNRTEFGVWGGMTERERRALLKRRPDVRSWRTLLESARNDGEPRADVTASPPEPRLSRPRGRCRPPRRPVEVVDVLGRGRDLHHRDPGVAGGEAPGQLLLPGGHVGLGRVQPQQRGRRLGVHLTVRAPAVEQLLGRRQRP